MSSQMSSFLHLPFSNCSPSFHRRPTALPFRPNHVFPLSAGITISLLLLALAQELPWPLRHRPLPLTRRPNSSLLFVCLGNICRSPAAEGVFRDIVKKRALDSNFKIDSAGTIDYHDGNLADPRMRAASKRRGIEITSVSRPIRPSDFRDFDVILAMDKQNRGISSIGYIGAFNRWKFRETLPDDAHKKFRLMCSYCKKHDETEVPDPYYGGPQGFEKVLDLLEDACESLLDSILAENSHLNS
ncbi:hypothetical protein SLE2022_354890 [Rubroshorea leprosula]